MQLYLNHGVAFTLSIHEKIKLTNFIKNTIDEIRNSVLY